MKHFEEEGIGYYVSVPLPVNGSHGANSIVKSATMGGKNGVPYKSKWVVSGGSVQITTHQKVEDDFFVSVSLTNNELKYWLKKNKEPCFTPRILTPLPDTRSHLTFEIEGAASSHLHINKKTQLEMIKKVGSSSRSTIFTSGIPVIGEATVTAFDSDNEYLGARRICQSDMSIFNENTTKVYRFRSKIIVYMPQCLMSDNVYITVLSASIKYPETLFVDHGMMVCVYDIPDSLEKVGNELEASMFYHELEVSMFYQIKHSKDNIKVFSDLTIMNAPKTSGFVDSDSVSWYNLEKLTKEGEIFSQNNDYFGCVNGGLVFFRTTQDDFQKYEIIQAVREHGYVSCRIKHYSLTPYNSDALPFRDGSKVVEMSRYSATFQCFIEEEKMDGGVLASVMIGKIKDPKDVFEISSVSICLDTSEATVTGKYTGDYAVSISFDTDPSESGKLYVDNNTDTFKISSSFSKTPASIVVHLYSRKDHPLLSKEIRIPTFDPHSSQTSSDGEKIVVYNETFSNFESVCTSSPETSYTRPEKIEFQVPLSAPRSKKITCQSGLVSVSHTLRIGLSLLSKPRILIDENSVTSSSADISVFWDVEDIAKSLSWYIVFESGEEVSCTSTMFHESEYKYSLKYHIKEPGTIMFVSRYLGEDVVSAVCDLDIRAFDETTVEGLKMIWNNGFVISGKIVSPFDPPFLVSLNEGGIEAFSEVEYSGKAFVTSTPSSFNKADATLQVNVCKQLGKSRQRICTLSVPVTPESYPPIESSCSLVKPGTVKAIFSSPMFCQGEYTVRDHDSKIVEDNENFKIFLIETRKTNDINIGLYLNDTKLLSSTSIILTTEHYGNCLLRYRRMFYDEGGVPSVEFVMKSSTGVVPEDTPLSVSMSASGTNIRTKIALADWKNEKLVLNLNRNFTEIGQFHLTLLMGLYPFGDCTFEISPSDIKTSFEVVEKSMNSDGKFEFTLMSQNMPALEESDLTYLVKEARRSNCDVKFVSKYIRSQDDKSFFHFVADSDEIGDLEVTFMYKLKFLWNVSVPIELSDFESPSLSFVLCSTHKPSPSDDPEFRMMTFNAVAKIFPSSKDDDLDRNKYKVLGRLNGGDELVGEIHHLTRMSKVILFRFPFSVSDGNERCKIKILLDNKVLTEQEVHVNTTSHDDDDYGYARAGGTRDPEYDPLYDTLFGDGVDGANVVDGANGANVVDGTDSGLLKVGGDDDTPGPSTMTDRQKMIRKLFVVLIGIVIAVLIILSIIAIIAIVRMAT